jgi:ferritin-like metal-binding protein YciE
MKSKNLADSFLEELKDIYHAEKQLVKALPKMIKAATCTSLRAGFEAHLEQTNTHVERIERIFSTLGETPKAVKCEAMEGLVKEGGEALDCKCPDSVRDALLIACAQKVEHYEIASYGTLRAWAEQLGYNEARKLLTDTLDEEKETDASLTELAYSHINRDAEIVAVVSE